MQSLSVGIGIVVLAALLIYSLANRSMGWLRMAQIFFYSIVVILSAIIYADANNLNQNFFSSENTLLLGEQGKLYAGIAGRVAQTPRAIEQPQLSEYQMLRDRDAYPELRGSSYKLFLFDIGAFWDIGEVRFGDDTVSRDEAIAILRADAPIEVYANIVAYRRGAVNRELIQTAIQRRFTSPEELKAKLFSTVVAEATRQQGKAFVPRSYRSKTLIVEPRTPYFLFLEYAPAFIVDLVVERG